MSFRRNGRPDAGFTLIELLIVIAIIGILAAIAIPNLLNALQRGKQKRTMADMRTLATAIESYNIDNSNYPTPNFTCPGPQVLPDNADTTNSTLTSSSWTLLRPTYIAEPPFQDGWTHPLHYSVDNVLNAYAIVSWGRDGSADGDGLLRHDDRFQFGHRVRERDFRRIPGRPQH